MLGDQGRCRSPHCANVLLRPSPPLFSAVRRPSISHCSGAIRSPRCCALLCNGAILHPVPALSSPRAGGARERALAYRGTVRRKGLEQRRGQSQRHAAENAGEVGRRVPAYCGGECRRIEETSAGLARKRAPAKRGKERQGNAEESASAVQGRGSA